MAEVTVTETPEEAPSFEEGVAHARAEQAGEAAEEAEGSAAVAGLAAAETAGAAEVAEESAAVSTVAASESLSARDDVIEMMRAQHTVLSSLVEELKAAREAQPAPAPRPVKKTTDRAPVTKKKSRGSWYYGR